MTPPISTTTTSTSVQILSLPNELLLIVAENFDHPSDVSSLTRTSRRLTLLLTPLLHKLALQDKHGASAIHWAATRGYEPLVRLALQSGVEVDGKDWMGRTPLHQAMESCHEATIGLLLAKGASVAARDLIGCTPLHIAMRGYTAIVRSLEGGNIDTSHYHENRALATRLQETAARVLLDHGADPNAQTSDGDTSLHYAARFCHSARSRQLIRLLLNKGADPLLKNWRHYKPSDHVLVWPQTYKMIKRREWRRDKGYIYASILCITGGYPYTKDKKYTLIRFLYGEDCHP